ncbi:unnamed protein product [Arctia plantaginis]|nr:unnamed protein product [Arctia plantaginis]
MQPLDVGLNGPFKSYYNAAIDSWLLCNPGKTLSIYNVAECVGIAYMRAMTPVNITQAFKKCGIFPFDDKIFTDIDFLPSEVTNRPAPKNETDAEVDFQKPDINERCGSPSILTPAFYGDNDETDADIENIIEEYHYSTPVPSTSYVRQPSPSVVDNEDVSSTKKTNSPEVFGIPNNFISPKIFRPPLKAEPRKNRFKRKAGKSMIATDTPEKNALAENKNPKQNKTRKRANVVKVTLFESSHKRVKSDTSSDEEDEFISSDSSSGGENFLDQSEEEEVLLCDNFPPLLRKPRVEDYVIIAFTTKKSKVYYIAQILEELEGEECDYYVSYFKLKNKVTQTFSLPLEPDTAGVNRKDITYILPPPITQGTARRQATYKFPVDMSLLNLRY